MSTGSSLRAAIDEVGSSSVLVEVEDVKPTQSSANPNACLPPLAAFVLGSYLLPSFV